MAEEQNLFHYGNTQQGPYTDFRMTVTVHNKQGKLVLPVADGSNKCDIVAVSDPRSVKVVNWTATRDGVPPEVPDPNKLMPNHELLESTRSSAVPTPNPDGLTQRWCMSGEYVYANQEEIPPGAAIKPGASPVSTSPAASNVYGESLLRQDLLDG